MRTPFLVQATSPGQEEESGIGNLGSQTHPDTTNETDGGTSELYPKLHARPSGGVSTTQYLHPMKASGLSVRRHQTPGGVSCQTKCYFSACMR
jgi:hypothetical protein